VISNSHERPATGTSSLSRPQGKTPLGQGQRTQPHALLTNAWVAAALVSTVTPSLARCLTRVWARVPWPHRRPVIHRVFTCREQPSTANTEASGADGGRPLHVAALRGHVEFVTALVELGADIGALMDNGETPLQLSIRYGHHHVARVLRGAQAWPTCPARVELHVRPRGLHLGPVLHRQLRSAPAPPLRTPAHVEAAGVWVS
jgi:hypothetical protein